MVTALATRNDYAIESPDNWSETRKEFIRKQYCGGAPDDIAEAFLQICQRRRLAPEEKHIYLVGRFDKKTNKNEFTIQTAIDGYRLIADRTGVYAGSDRPAFTFEGDRLIEAEVTVWKFVQGQRCPFTAVAYMSEYKPSFSFLWDKMPRTMLAKCAEALALRKAFPAELSGIFTNEEMDQANGSTQPEPNGDNHTPTNLRDLRKPKATATVQPPTEIIEGDVVDTSTGEIIETTIADNDEADRERFMKKLWASARNKITDDQIHTIARAAWDVRSLKDLTTDKLKMFSDAVYDLTIAKSEVFVGICDALIDDPSRDAEPLNSAELNAIASEIGKHGFGGALRAVLRDAYVRAEDRLKDSTQH